ncbi:MAG: phosphodiester glycosidase family protein [Actinomycetia bacterium]|nr:phosphodiester glycosidase family protein [Actinomycetes bacterium]
MKPSRTRAAAIGIAAVATLAVATPGATADDARPQSNDQRAGETLPLGDSDLPESRDTRTLTRGVELTTIVRGDEPADEDEFTTTTRGPWQVQVLTIDPRKAKGRLRATYGEDIAKTEPTSDLADQIGAVAAMNASFFTFTASDDYPGDPVGTAIHDGRLISEPLQAEENAVSVLVDSRRGRVRIAKPYWSRVVTNKATGHSVQIEYVNHPPVVPADCTGLDDQRDCASDGDIALFTPEFHESTPEGPGIEVVLDRRQCVVRVAETRGITLAPGQTSLQATGRDVATLRLAAGHGCVRQRQALTDESGRRLRIDKHTYGVTGRYRLVRDGENVAPGVVDDFTDRHPRSAIGTTRSGKIVLFTIDGRQPTSVGATLDETAEVARSLGLVQAANLDGGGSTTMVADGEVVNSVSGVKERPVGDALVYVD